MVCWTTAITKLIAIKVEGPKLNWPYCFAIQAYLVKTDEVVDLDLS